MLWSYGLMVCSLLTLSVHVGAELPLWVGLILMLCMSHTTNRALQRVKLGNALEIRNRIILKFYPGLPQSWH